MLHPDDVSYFDELRALGLAVAIKTGIAVRVIEPKRRPLGEASGLCYPDEQRIAIEVRAKARAEHGGAWRTERHSDQHNRHTLAHELAHLLEYQRHGKTGHGERFKQYEQQLLAEVTNAR